MKISFTKHNGPIDEIIEKLMETAEGIGRPKYVREMILASLKAGQEADESADLKLMNTTLKEMRFTSKVFGPYRNVRKVTVFGSARTLPGDPVYEMASLFGKKLAETGYMVITGGGGGIMQAVNEGAGPEHSFGVNIRLPFEEKPNPVSEGNPRFITYKYFFNRKVAFLKEADAVALFPGGFGTLDEAMETLTLVQTGKRNPMPLVLVDDPDRPYWPHLIQFLEEELLARNFICPSDFALFERVCSVDAAVEKIRHFYRRYHSLRYVHGQLVIRLTSPLSPDDIRNLTDQFHDILLPGGRIAASGALEAEREDADVMHLPRLVIDFNRKGFGRLRSLIDSINDFSPSFTLPGTAAGSRRRGGRILFIRDPCSGFQSMIDFLPATHGVDEQLKPIKK
ncbi:MAG TPA: TIGR00730 family Rossman fold protein [Syntrophales bacterium]